MQFSKLGPLFLRVLLIWVPYYLRDLKRGRNLENYSYIKPWKPQALFFEQGLGFRAPKALNP